MGSPRKRQCKAGKAVEPTPQRRHRSLRAGFCKSNDGRKADDAFGAQSLLGIFASSGSSFEN